MSAETIDEQAELNRRWAEAEETLRTPDVGETGSDEWRAGMLKKQAAIAMMLLDNRLPELESQRLQSLYDHQQRNLDELARQQQRNWEMEQRAKEIDLETQYRAVSLKYAEASQKSPKLRLKERSATQGVRKSRRLPYRERRGSSHLPRSFWRSQPSCSCM